MIPQHMWLNYLHVSAKFGGGEAGSEVIQDRCGHVLLRREYIIDHDIQIR